MSRDRLPPGDLRLLAVVALAACALVLAILVRRYGALAMKRLAVLAVVAVALSGCATADRLAMLENLQGCAREYNGVVTGGLIGSGFSGSVKVSCPPTVPAP